LFKWFSNVYRYAFSRDAALISGTSPWKDKLDKKIADPKFTLSLAPVSGAIADKYFITSDGYEATDSTIIDKGVLKHFLLSIYASNKTGHTRAPNNGEGRIIDPGDESFKDMVKKVQKGLLLCRFSGGRPNDNGDISGVAKNSYYIENGEIQYPINETTLSGNLRDMLNSITAISSERINFGHSILPWLQTSGITISGK